MRSQIKNVIALGAVAVLWLMTVLGCFIVAMSLTQMFVLATGVRPASSIFTAGLAPTFPDAIGDAAFGVALAAISSVLRGAIRRWQHPPPDGTQAP